MKYQQAFTECTYCHKRRVPVPNSETITAVCCQNCLQVYEIHRANDGHIVAYFASDKLINPEKDKSFV